MDQAPLQRLREAGFEVIDNPYKRKLTKNELLELLPRIDGLIAGLEPLNKEVLSKSKLKIISRCGAGLSKVHRDEGRLEQQLRHRSAGNSGWRRVDVRGDSHRHLGSRNRKNANPSGDGAPVMQKRSPPHRLVQPRQHNLRDQ